MSAYGFTTLDVERTVSQAASPIPGGSASPANATTASPRPSRRMAGGALDAELFVYRIPREGEGVACHAPLTQAEAVERLAAEAGCGREWAAVFVRKAARNPAGFRVTTRAQDGGWVVVENATVRSVA